jgi:hypothetical protein
MNQLHAEYRRRRAADWSANEAWKAAHTVVAFETAADAGLVRFRVVRDEWTNADELWCPTGRPSDDRRVRERFLRQADDWGLWGIVSEVRCPCCGQWTVADSCWGFVGDGWRDSAYDTDVMDAALAKLQENQHASN